MAANMKKECVGDQISTKHTQSEKMRCIALNHAKHKTSNGATYDITATLNQDGARVAKISMYTKKGDVIVNPLAHYADKMET